MAKRKGSQNTTGRRPNPDTRRRTDNQAVHQAAHQGGGGQRYWLYGLHAAEAALLNPARTVHRLAATAEVAKHMDASLRGRLAERGLEAMVGSREELAALLPPGVVHQGLAAEVSPLEQPALRELLDRLHRTPGPPSRAAGHPASTNGPQRRVVLVALDQVTDPQNVGAVLRSAAAFGAAAVLGPRHGQAPETAALAKAASGALEHIPYVDAGNLARALGLLKKRDFWVLGLAAEATARLAEADPGGRTVLVLGAEGKGLRRLTRESCDLLARLPTRPPVGQLNVSNAAAVALYELLGRGKPD
jgi:23S rRNA (guanosine2251-2'-O)-methyltransferase